MLFWNTRPRCLHPLISSLIPETPLSPRRPCFAPDSPGSSDTTSVCASVSARGRCCYLKKAGIHLQQVSAPLGRVSALYIMLMRHKGNDLRLGNSRFLLPSSHFEVWIHSPELRFDWIEKLPSKAGQRWGGKVMFQAVISIAAFGNRQSRS